MNQNEVIDDPDILLNSLQQLRSEIYQEGMETYQRWEPSIKRTAFHNSAMNLAFYLSLRRRDIRGLQKSLIPWGLSSLGRLESKTLENIDAVIASLTKITDQMDTSVEYPPFDSFMKGRNQLDDNSNLVLGEDPDHRYTRIMVTLPTEAAENNQYVSDLIEQGMNVARINCAHDDPSIWSKMIQHIKQANQQLNRNCKILMDVAGPKIRTEQINKKVRKVNVGDVFFLTDNKQLESYKGIKNVIGCSIPEIIPTLKKGDAVLYDDGKMIGKGEKVTDDGVIVKVKNVKNQKGIKLKAEKGINFPVKDLRIDLLTEKDRQDLDFVCEYADIIGCSFVKTPDDIMLIQTEIRKRLNEERAEQIALMVKMETVQGVENLPEIIVTAAGKNPLCVMIARGDLAVEIGYLRLAELQEEILCICEAADIPVVWATQVLESMLKSGIPTRAEISDASKGAKAEFVMLNKGPYVVKGIRTLDEILEKMQEHQYKKTSKLRALSLAKKPIN